MQPRIGGRRGGVLRVGFGAMIALGVAMVLAACATGSAGGPGSSATVPAPAASETAAGPSLAPSSTSTSPSSIASSTPEVEVTVTIVSSGADGADVFASGLVTGEVGADGTCTLTATSETGRVLTAQAEAHATPAAVNCGLIKIAAEPGDWTLVLSFASPTSGGSSSSVLVHQP